jgi:hypothetical protein
VDLGFISRALLAAEAALEDERGHAVAIQVADRLDAFRLEDQFAVDFSLGGR